MAAANAKFPAVEMTSELRRPDSDIVLDGLLPRNDLAGTGASYAAYLSLLAISDTLI